MKVMLVGGGGREHAIIKKIKDNPKIDKLYALPGNGGIARDAVCVPIKATDLDGIVRFAGEQKIDYAVIAPDDPLVAGLTDMLEDIGVMTFGPHKDAAIIEGSKAFAKGLMKKYKIPTAAYETFTDIDMALGYIDTVGAPVVVKADGLALGKGVIIAETPDETKKTVI